MAKPKGDSNVRISKPPGAARFFLSKPSSNAAWRSSARRSNPFAAATPNCRTLTPLSSAAFFWLKGAHIDPYEKAASVYNHDPRRDRKLLAHRREITKLLSELDVRGTTLVPLAIYFKEGRAKVEIGVARGKQRHDKRDTIKKKEMDRDLRRAMTIRQ